MPEAAPAALAHDLEQAAGIDEVAAALLGALAELPGALRVGFALSEGGGRRLQFTASDRSTGEAVDWCHIDAYDDVPLTLVARTGEPVLGTCEELEQRFGTFVAAQPDDVAGLAAVPLRINGAPVGGFVLYVDEQWRFDEAQRRLLETIAGRAAEAVRRVRAGGSDGRDHELRPDEGSPSAQMVLDDDPRSAGAARRFLRDFLEGADVPPGLVDTAELCLSELVTNALLHAGGRVEVRVDLEGSLTVSVLDRGSASLDAEPDDADPLRVYGRGLLLVEALTDAWGSERDGAGHRAWFCLDLARSDG